MPTYQCDQCGACCRHLIVEIDALDIAREPKLIGAIEPFKPPPDDCDPDDDWHVMIACGSARPCPMLGDDSRCSIYPTRPNVCVGFRAGSEQCQDARRMAGLPELGPVETGVAIGEEKQ